MTETSVELKLEEKKGT